MEITPPQSNTNLPIQPQKTWTPKFIALILGLVILGIAAYAGVWYWRSTIPVPTGPLPVHKAQELKTYANVENGFELKYPSSWLVADKKAALSDYLPGEGQRSFVAIYPTSGRQDFDGRIDVYAVPKATVLVDDQYLKNETKVGDIVIIGITWTHFTTPTGDDYFAEVNNKTYEVSGTKAITDQILSTFKFAEATSPILPPQGKGTLVGHVDIGPICPVEQIESPCNPTPDMYKSRQVTVYAADGKTSVAKKYLDDGGNFNFILDPATYYLSVAPAGIMKDSMHQAIVTAGKITTVDISIDTGIR